MEIKTVEYIVFFTIIIIPTIMAFRHKPSPSNLRGSQSVHPINKCESPIERRLYTGLTMHGIYPTPQYRVGYYRLDFAIVNQKIAIEADGKDYHSSPTQKAHDRKRDKYLKDNGWTVLRFSGKRIYRDLPNVVAKIKEQL